MSTSVLQDYDPQGNHCNLESFSILWLDANSDEHSDLKLQQQLRSIGNHLVIFKKREEWQKYIKHLKKEDRLILITSGQLNKEIVPNIHQYR